MTDTSVVAKWYDQNAALEHNRLVTSCIEYSITMRVIKQCLLELSASSRNQVRILDLGGGTGRYAVELARLGHSVTLSDISQSELDYAAKFAIDSGVILENIVQADARQVRNNKELFRKGHYDLVLCMGPMYHLLEECERLALLESCSLMTKPEGFIVASFVTKYAHLRDIAQRDPKRLSDESDFYAQYLSTGKYTRNSGNIVSHHVDVGDIRGLFNKLQRNGLANTRLERLVGCEGFLGGGLGAAINLNDAETYEAWVDVLARYSMDPHVLGSSDHIVAVARRDG
ncbi:hypothetical protein MGYG_03839 [Nannizzia gypsea CBS 118893]|uniref:Methyltransferase domain-containing protein n=1 Tax=Arthroderma gypseum (strain ATCC MYA-4604 / CBS 118893) TaxID=535722 RepID=E4UU68_ARTGP|nr:hypothetical protein MGYG_03839 [Nannizzia gypsea CBS 118893]EFR00835.1 hypothetical protein MGYG_03839 [Nannizzia gypsea CBS 118893]